MRHHRTPSTRGFTLIELLVVVAIIGILMTFILIAAGGAVRRAEEKATLSLITKLEMGLSERIEAILARRADIYLAHLDMAAIYTTAGGRIDSPQRSQVIAQIDLVRAEIPDVFFVQNDTHYPLNFASLPYANGSNFVPLGAVVGDPIRPILGAYGATWQAMSGLHKRLGYLPSGYDGTDNNGNGLIDDLQEGIGTDPMVDDPDSAGTTHTQVKLSALIARRLGNHTHNTARSEMLYALLVDGQGPLGSVFNANEFTAKEVADTDNDGLPEFIDAWGQPLQFYRWPIFYNGDYPTGTGNQTASSIQKGLLRYNAISEPRAIDPLDPNQQLMAIPWFYKTNQNWAFTGTNDWSGSATAFMTYFHTLVDQNFVPGANNPSGPLWDRSGFFGRRAYYSRPLILSGGPDKLLGVLQLPNSPTPMALQLIGSPLSPGENTAFQPQLPSLSVNGQDDISNQSLASPGGGVR